MARRPNPTNSVPNNRSPAYTRGRLAGLTPRPDAAGAAAPVPPRCEARNKRRRADRRPVGPDDEVALLVPGDRAVVGLGGPFADHHFAGDVTLGALPGARPRHPQRPAGPQAGDQLALERAAAPNVKGLVDRLVGDPHGLILGEVDRQPVRDLLRTPRGSPPSIPSAGLVPGLPLRRDRAGRRSAVRALDHAGQPVLDVVAKPVVLDELAVFGRRAINSAFHCAIPAR